jgi:Protein of unknown function (DUF2442)
MSSSADYLEKDRPVEAWCDLHNVHLRLANGRQISTPLSWYRRLLKASPAQRNTVELMIDGVHWPEVDEDLSIDGMLKGRKVPAPASRPSRQSN